MDDTPAMMKIVKCKLVTQRFKIGDGFVEHNWP